MAWETIDISACAFPPTASFSKHGIKAYTCSPFEDCLSTNAGSSYGDEDEDEDEIEDDSIIESSDRGSDSGDELFELGEIEDEEFDTSIGSSNNSGFFSQGETTFEGDTLYT